MHSDYVLSCIQKGKSNFFSTQNIINDFPYKSICYDHSPTVSLELNDKQTLNLWKIPRQTYRKFNSCYEETA